MREIFWQKLINDLPKILHITGKTIPNFFQKEGKRMYNYYPQQTQSPQPQRLALYPLKGHPVSSLEEVRALSIDFDGSIFYFPDIANKRIYTKQINVMDGTAQLNMYELKPLPAEPTADEYITRTEFQQTLDALLAKLTPPSTTESSSVTKQF